MKKFNFNKKIGLIVAGVGLGLFALNYGFGVIRSQEVGQVGVWTTFDKRFVKTTEDTGVNSLNPLNKVTYYDIKNNTVKFAGDGTQEDKNSIMSPSVTINNKEGVEGEIEFSVIYSVEPDKVKEIWSEYGSQERFNDVYVVQTIRSIARDSFKGYTSLESYNKRGEISKSLQKEIKKEFDGTGIVIDQVSLQGIKYSSEIVKSFDSYQKKAIEIENAKANRDKELIEANKRVEVAKLDAQANDLKTKSLSQEVLQEKYIQAIKDTKNKVIITDGKTPVIMTDK